MSLLMNINTSFAVPETELLSNLGIATRNAYKWPPPNLKKSDEKTFWGHRSVWSFVAEAHGDKININGGWADTLLYFCGGGHRAKGGFAVLVFYHPEYRVEYYEWTKCQHEFDTKVLGNCWRKHTCKKCDASYEVDSSD